MVKGIPMKLHELASYYRGSANGDRKGPVDFIDDVLFLAGHFANQCVNYIRGALKAVTGMLESQPVMALRLQLSVALAITLDFTTRVIQVTIVLIIVPSS